MEFSLELHTPRSIHELEELQRIYSDHLPLALIKETFEQECHFQIQDAHRLLKYAMKVLEMYKENQAISDEGKVDALTEHLSSEANQIPQTLPTIKQEHSSLYDRPLKTGGFEVIDLSGMDSSMPSLEDLPDSNLPNNVSNNSSSQSILQSSSVEDSSDISNNGNNSNNSNGQVSDLSDSSVSDSEHDKKEEEKDEMPSKPLVWEISDNESLSSYTLEEPKKWKRIKKIKDESHNDMSHSEFEEISSSSSDSSSSSSESDSEESSDSESITTRTRRKRKNPPKTNQKKDTKRQKGRLHPSIEAKVVGLPDYFDYNLDVVFVGYNPGVKAGTSGHYYAGPNNHFYELLHLSGFVPRRFACHEDKSLLEHGIGLTKIVDRTSHSNADLTKTEMSDGGKVLLDRLRQYQPKVVCFNGMGVFQACNKDTPCENLGTQKMKFEGISSHLFVIPSTSGRVSQYTKSAKLVLFKELKKLVESCRTAHA